MAFLVSLRLCVGGRITQNCYSGLLWNEFVFYKIPQAPFLHKSHPKRGIYRLFRGKKFRCICCLKFSRMSLYLTANEVFLGGGPPALLLSFNEQPSFACQKQALILSISWFPEIRVPPQSCLSCWFISQTFSSQRVQAPISSRPTWLSQIPN